MNLYGETFHGGNNANFSDSVQAKFKMNWKSEYETVLNLRAYRS